MNDLEKVLFDPTPDLLDPPYEKSEIAAREWQEMIERLKVLQKQNKLTFEAYAADTPYSLHVCQIYLKFDEIGNSILKASDVREIFARVSDLIVDEERSGWWQVSRRIYVPSDK